MVVEFIKQLHQDSLEKAWNARPAKDPMPERRKNVLSRIDVALAQLKKGEINPARGCYQTRDNFNGVRVQLKYGQRPLVIDGRDHWFVEDAATFFKSAREAVASGQLDGAINDALEARDKGKGPRPAPSSTRPAPKSKPLEPEKASIAAKPPAASPSAPAAVTAAAAPVVSRAAPAAAPAAASPVASPAVSPAAPPAQDTSAVEPATARPGKFARKYEKLLAAGIISEAAS